LPAVVSPTTDSPGYIPESDPEGDPEEEDEEDPEEDPAYYPADIGDDDEEDEEEEHLPAVDPLLVLRFPRVVYLLGRGLGAARHDVPAIPREAPYVVAREDLYKFVGMVDNAPRHPGCPISRELDYGITDEWDGLVEAIEEIAPTTIEGVNRNITDLSTTFDQETTIMHGLMEDARDDRSELRGRVNLLYRDRPIHHHLAVIDKIVEAI
ncbi:hypothetical protein Tco_0756914, partial [Tanacetum coccineum]